MDIKKTNAAQTTKTYNRDQIENETQNIYEAISIISKRADQIKGDVKKELIEKLEELSIDIHKFLELGKNVKKIDKQKKAIKINNKFKCIPKKFKNKFMEKFMIPEDISIILNKAIYCFNGRIRNSLAT